MLGGSWRSGESARRCRSKKGRRWLDVDLGSGHADEAIGYAEMEHTGKVREERGRAARACGLDVQNPRAGLTETRGPNAQEVPGESAGASAKEGACHSPVDRRRRGAGARVCWSRGRTDQAGVVGFAWGADQT